MCGHGRVLLERQILLLNKGKGKKQGEVAVCGGGFILRERNAGMGDGLSVCPCWSWWDFTVGSQRGTRCRQKTGKISGLSREARRFKKPRKMGSACDFYGRGKALAQELAGNSGYLLTNGADVLSHAGWK